MHSSIAFFLQSSDLGDLTVGGFVMVKDELDIGQIGLLTVVFDKFVQIVPFFIERGNRTY